MKNPLAHIYNNCDPGIPATAEYYHNCADARGGSALVHEFKRHLALAKDYIYFLFSGHIGCGKSSELAQLKRALTSARPPYKCYFPVLINASDYLDDYDAT